MKSNSFSVFFNMTTVFLDAILCILGTFQCTTKTDKNYASLLLERNKQ